MYKRNAAEKKKIFMDIDPYSFVPKRFEGFGASKEKMKSAVRRIKWISHRENLSGGSSPSGTVRAGMVTEQSRAGLC